MSENDGIDLEKFCFYPFAQMLLQPTGDISPCCFNQKIVLGQVPRDQVLEIWNSDRMRSLRREFLSGNPVSCAEQMRHIGCHRWTRHFAGKVGLSEIQTQPPRRLDLRLNGKCNLQCVMCGVWKQPNGIYDQSQLWTLGPKEIFPHLMEIDVLGGEPFIQSDTYRLIDEISAVNSKCSWSFVTNGQYKVNEAIKSRLDKISIRWIMVSLDSLDPLTYAKIRKGGNLDRILASIEAFEEYRTRRTAEGRGFELSLSMCVQKANWREIGKFLDYAQTKDLSSTLQFAYEPDSISLLSLSREEREEAMAVLEKLGQDRDLIDPILKPLQESFAK